MFAEVARDEPQPQGALWVAIAAEGPPGALERRRVTPVPLGMQNGKPLGRDARQVLLARKRITVEPRIVEPKLDRPPGMAAGFVHPALFPQDGCQIRLDLRQVGPQGQRLPQGGLGLRQAALRLQGDTQVVVGLGQLSVQGDGPMAGRFGLFPSPLRIKHAAQIVMGLGEVGLPARGLTIGEFGLPPALTGFPNSAQVQPACRMPGIDRQNLPEQ